jgi:hypothetical protein
MPAHATLEELKAVYERLTELKNRHPEAARALVALLKKERRIGYKNICKMLTGEATPEKLKGGAALAEPGARIGSQP